jgi:hypothetical protein
MIKVVHGGKWLLSDKGRRKARLVTKKGEGSDCAAKIILTPALTWFIPPFNANPAP